MHYLKIKRVPLFYDLTAYQNLGQKIVKIFVDTYFGPNDDINRTF